MAINTATIQHRRGSLDDFNPEKLTPGELAVITDERSVYMGFPDGEAEKIVLEKDFTSESIKEKLGYEPADEERVDQLFRDKADYQYVDKKVSNVKVDLTGYAKEDYVDDEIEELNKKIVQETGKLSEENAELKSDLDNCSDSIGEYVKQDIFIQAGKVTTTGAWANDTSAQYTKLSCAEGEKYKLTARQGIYISLYVITDSIGSVLKYKPLPSEQIDYIDYEIKIPSNGAYLYVSSNLLYDLIVKKYVYHNLNKVFNNYNDYRYIKDGYNNLVNSFRKFGTATLDDFSKVTVTDINGGIQSNFFTANSPKVMVKVKGRTSCSNIFINLRNNKNDGTDYFTLLDNITVTDGVIDLVTYFDSANLIVYQNAKQFTIIVNTPDTSGEIEITEMTVVNLEGYQTHELYDSEFSGLIKNVFTKTDDIQSQVNTIVTETAPVITNGNGDKYTIQIGIDGTLKSIPHIPSKVLFMGNSLLLGMDTNGLHGGAFGLCATSPQNDYCYHVEQAILAKNSECVFSKLHDAVFEQAESNEAFTSCITSNESAWTSDLDLIIIQIGDNVNSEIRETTFKNNLPNMIKIIKTNSPNARVLFVSGWFNYNKIADSIMTIVTSRGCEFLNINSLRNDGSNYGTTGATITYYDGTTTTAQESWVSHPGDIGFQRIADMIIEKLDM